MKAFKFNLETTLRYKTQILKRLKREHGLILAAIKKKEMEIAALERAYHRYRDAFNAEKETGMRVLEAVSRQEHIRVLQRDIKAQYDILEKLRADEQKKRMESVAAKKETAALEKLREKRVAEYDQLCQKADERFVEEFVSNRWALQKIQDRARFGYGERIG